VAVELQTVQDARAVVEAEDVLGKQIPVVFDHPPFPDPRVEQGLAAGETSAYQPLGLLHAVGHGAVVGQCTDVGEARLPTRDSTPRLPGNGPERIVDGRALPCELGEATLPRHMALTTTVARRSPGSHRGVVQERQVNRFLELVGAVMDEEHHGGVGLAHLRARERRGRVSGPEPECGRGGCLDTTCFPWWLGSAMGDDSDRAARVVDGGLGHRAQVRSQVGVVPASADD
jgi:hypothetical protein